MAKNTNKTRPTDLSPQEFVAAVEHPVRREDAQRLLKLMTEVTGVEARMWGAALVGFGTYDYRYASGREGTWFRCGFSPRKAQMVLYVMPGFDGSEGLLSRLGKHSTGKSCLYIKKLADVDIDVLQELIEASLREMTARYG